jgi:hypothetical protein
MTTVSPTFYRIAGLASILSAVTTLILIVAPEFYAVVPGGIEGRMRRVADPAYQFRAWTYFLHPFLVLTACTGLAFACRRAGPELALFGLMAMGLWALTEAAQQALTLFAFDDWRRAWLAGDAAVRATIEVRVAIYDGLWEAAYSLLLFGIIIGSALFAAMLLRLRDKFSQILGVFFALAAIQSIFIQSGELGGPIVPDSIAFWIYPATQPLARLLLGLWLLRVARDGEPRVGAGA